MSLKKVEIREIEHFEDERGGVLKVLQRENMGESVFGEIYISKAFSGITKAQHYHKYTNEWFCVIKGTAKLVLMDIKSLERKEILMGGEQLITVKVPSGVAHAVQNIGEDTMYLVAVSDQPYDPQKPDTFPYSITI